MTPSRAGSNPAIPASLNIIVFCRMTKAVSINVTQKVAKDRDLAIGLFSFLLNVSRYRDIINVEEIEYAYNSIILWYYYPNVFLEF